MSESSGSLSVIEGLIARLRAGDAAARDGLLRAAADRLLRLARRMLRDQGKVRRWEETDDVYQASMLRLWKVLEDHVPESPAAFFRLAALVIRRELLDLARHYYGPQGHGAHHAPVGVDTGDSAERGVPDNSTYDPQRLASWTEFHESVSRLPKEEREVFDLLWYHGLSQTEAAAALGVSERTVQRRWQAARVALHAQLGEHQRSTD